MLDFQDTNLLHFYQLELLVEAFNSERKRTASVSLSGRVLTAAGRGLRNAQVTLTEADGSTRTILTGNFGNYNFANLAAGQTAVLTVRSKRYRFLPQIIILTDDFNEVNFVAKL